jgi:hypothetical protein
MPATTEKGPVGEANRGKKGGNTKNGRAWYHRQCLQKTWHGCKSGRMKSSNCGIKLTSQNGLGASLVGNSVQGPFLLVQKNLDKIECCHGQRRS